MTKAQMARLADTDDDFARFNVKRNMPEPKEDGLRSTGGKDTFEWWYTDADFEDGTTVVVIFFTKNYFDTAGPAWPTVDFEVTDKNGGRINVFIQGDRGTLINASQDKCDVKIGNCFIRYEKDGAYHVHYEDNRITYDAIMRPKMPMWRPGTGYWQFGEGQQEKLYGWFVALPEAEVDATLTIDGKTRILEDGHGYHDHNWGGASLDYLMNHWYWGRAKIGDYNVIACDIITNKRYGNKRLPVFMVAKGQKILNDNAHITQVRRGGTRIHPSTKKFLDDRLIYTQKVSEDEEYVIDFNRRYDIMYRSLLEVVSPLKRKLAEIIRMNPTYLRIGGDVSLTVRRNGEEETYTQEGLWEQYFTGSNKNAVIEGVAYNAEP